MTWLPWLVCGALGFAFLVCVVAWLDERKRARSLERRLSALVVEPDPDPVLFLWDDGGEL